MTTPTAVPADGALRLLRCPGCRGGLEPRGVGLACPTCAVVYSFIRGVPVLLAPGRPLLAWRNEPGNHPTRWRRLRSAVRARLPVLVLNVGARRAVPRFLALLAAETVSPVILNVGEKHRGPVLRHLRELAGATILQCDGALGPESTLLADPRRLPLADASVDAVVVDSGLEHIPDPAEAVREMRRVLRPRGLLYADFPFMMPVHAGAHDYARLSSAGLRALFREFEEIERGVSCGPAMALGQSAQYFLLSWVRRQWARVAVKLIGRFALFWVKYLDLIRPQRPGAFDCAAGTYLLARRAERVVAEEELEHAYRGIVPSMYEPLSGGVTSH